MSEIFFIYCLNGSLGFTHACCWIKLFSWNTHSFLPRTLRYRDQILTLLEIMFYLLPMKLFWLKKKWFRGREKLRSAKRRAFVRIQEKKRRDASSHPRSTTTHSKTSEAPSLGLSTGSLFTSSQPVFCMQSFRGWPPQLTDKCFSCGQRGHWANSSSCPNRFRGTASAVPSSKNSNWW